MTFDPLPIAIISFDRPDYLAQVLDSLIAQRNGIGGRRIALFQDGPWSPTMNKLHADPALIRQCVHIFRDRIPYGEVFESDTNLGIAMNIDRAERFVFETIGASAGIFIEEDLVLCPVYLTVLERLIELALADERIGYVAAFGNYKASVEQQLINPRKLRPLHLLWGFGITRRHWLKCRPYILQYLDLVRGVDYRQRDHSRIRELVASWGVEPGDTGQDRIKSFVTAFVGATKLNTEVAYARYIGERGMNFTPDSFLEWGFSGAGCVSEVQSLDFDLAAVNFDPWFAGNNLAKLKVPDISAAETTVTESSKASHEAFEDSFISALYRVLLLRGPDRGGLASYVKLLQNGQMPEAVIRGILRSNEFATKSARFLETYVLSGKPLETSLQPEMTPKEQELLGSFLRCSERYLEFGSGGSTVLAATYVKESVTSVDSSEVWQAKVAQACAAAGARIVPLLIHVDIGPVGDWGHPVDETSKARWPDYASTVWARPKAWMSDLCLVDGRFRVASFISTLLHCSPLTTVMIHDFPEREQYHIVGQFADEIAATDSLVAFRRKPDFNPERALLILEQRKFQQD